MLYGERFDVGGERQAVNLLLIGVPVGMGKGRELGTMRREDMGFAQEVGHRETDIKGRITPMDDFVVEQDEAGIENQDVLGAVVAVNKGEDTAAGGLNELIDEGGGLRHL